VFPDGGGGEGDGVGEGEGGVDAGPLAASAVAAKFTLAPGERRSVRFAIAWDLPLAVFPRGPAFAKRYTKVWQCTLKRADTRVKSAWN